MLMTDTQDITRLLRESRSGDARATDELIGVVYTGLKRVARRYMRAERADHTLQPTAIVHEAFLRLFQPGDNAEGRLQSVPIDWQNRAHFLGVAAKQMRQILIDHGRGRNAAKRAGLKVSLEDAVGISLPPEQDFEELDRMLTLLETKDPEAARVVELKFFGGLTDEEAAELMGVSSARLRRSWVFARSWLRHRMLPQTV